MHLREFTELSNSLFMGTDKVEEPYVSHTQFDSKKRYPIRSFVKDGKWIHIIYILDFIDMPKFFFEMIAVIQGCGKDDKVFLVFDSPGGYVTSCSAVVDALLTTKATTYSVILSIAASSAAMMTSACDNIITGSASQIMYHMSIHSDYGNSIDIKQNADKIVRFAEYFLKELTVSRNLITEEEFNKIMNESSYMLWICGDDLTKRIEGMTPHPQRKR